MPRASTACANLSAAATASSRVAGTGGAARVGAVAGGGGAMPSGVATAGAALGAAVGPGARIGARPMLVAVSDGDGDGLVNVAGSGGTAGGSVVGLERSEGACWNGGGLVAAGIAGGFATGADFGVAIGTGTGDDGCLPIGGGIVPRSESRDSDETSPITMHSASALTASMRPAGAGGRGRGSAGSVAGRGGTLGGAGLSDVRAFSSSDRMTRLSSSGARNFTVMPTRPYSTDGVFAELTTSAWPSIITPPLVSASANRPLRPAGNGSAIGMNITPLRSAYRRNAEMNSSPVVQAETR